MKWPGTAVRFADLLFVPFAGLAIPPPSPSLLFGNMIPPWLVPDGPRVRSRVVSWSANSAPPTHWMPLPLATIILLEPLEKGLPTTWSCMTVMLSWIDTMEWFCPVTLTGGKWTISQLVSPFLPKQNLKFSKFASKILLNFILVLDWRGRPLVFRVNVGQNWGQNLTGKKRIHRGYKPQRRYFQVGTFP